MWGLMKTAKFLLAPLRSRITQSHSVYANIKDFLKFCRKQTFLTLFILTSPYLFDLWDIFVMKYSLIFKRTMVPMVPNLVKTIGQGCSHLKTWLELTDLLPYGWWHRPQSFITGVSPQGCLSVFRTWQLSSSTSDLKDSKATLIEIQRYITGTLIFLMT